MKAAVLALSWSVALTAAVVVATAHGAQQPDAAVGDGRQTPEGKVLYLKNCRQCHGVAGTPSPQSKRKYDKIKDFTDPEFFKARSDDSLRVVIAKGAGRDLNGFGDKLSKEQIGAVVEYLHVLAQHK